MSRLTTLVFTLVALLTLCAGPARGQGPDVGDGVRLGISFGGISTFGFTVEYFDDARSVELGVGTWSFRDLSVSGVAKQYFGAGAAQPFVGLGLWLVAAGPREEGERAGLALALRAPIGVDWGFADDHAVGAVLNVNRGLAVRRSDPDDDLPMNDRLVPLPGIYYRLTR